MLVKCEKCKQSYDVDETRLSPRGARIKCPSCGNIFLVQPQSKAEPASPDVPLLSHSNPAPETIWKILHIGLTYTFHDLESLRSWLSSRPSLDDVKIAKGDDEWLELGDYPEVMTTEMITRFFPLGDVPTSKSASAKSGTDDKSPSLDTSLRTPSMIGAAVPSAPVAVSRNLSEPVEMSAKSTRKIQKERIKAEAQQKKMKKKIAIAVVVVVILFAAVIVLARYLKANTPGMPSAVISAPQPAPAVPVPVEEVKPQAVKDPVPLPPVNPNAPTEEEIAELAELELQKQLGEADEMVQKKLWPEARATLEQLAQDMPDQLEVLNLLVKTYRGLGLNDKVAETEKHIQKVKADRKKMVQETEDSESADH